MIKNSENKSKKTKTIHMRYPAPYSWSQNASYDRKPSFMKKSVSYDSKNKFAKRKATIKCCDPYAPHLKYGIFPRKSSKEVESSKVNLKKISSSQQMANDGKIHGSDEPYFIIRPLNKGDMKQLSVSKVSHLDIEPKLRKSQVGPTSSLRFNK